jgi:hypothetical protein
MDVGEFGLAPVKVEMTELRSERIEFMMRVGQLAAVSSEPSAVPTLPGKRK